MDNTKTLQVALDRINAAIRPEIEAECWNFLSPQDQAILAAEISRVIEGELRASLVQAWDEGAEAAHYDPEIRGFIATGENPYRVGRQS